MGDNVMRDGRYRRANLKSSLPQNECSCWLPANAARVISLT